MKRFRYPLVLLLFVVQTSVLASDIARDVREGREDESLVLNGYLEFSGGFSLENKPVPGSKLLNLYYDLGGHFRYKRFFVDALAESYNQLQVGVTATNSGMWSVDLLAAVNDNGLVSKLNDEVAALTQRKLGIHLGVRATAYNGPYILQFEALQEAFGLHGGHLLTATLAKQWLVRNWNIHALAGTRYESSKAMNHQFGIDATEATDRYPAYESDAGFTWVAEVGVTYPVTENIVFKSTTRYWQLPSSAASSPFITRDYYLTLINSLTFVY